MLPIILENHSNFAFNVYNIQYYIITVQYLYLVFVALFPLCPSKCIFVMFVLLLLYCFCELHVGGRVHAPVWVMCVYSCTRRPL